MTSYTPLLCRCLLLLCAAWTLSSCAGDDLPPAPGGGGDTEGNVFVTLSVGAAQTGGRASAGETGDGTETGQDGTLAGRENSVHDLSVFIYTGSANTAADRARTFKRGFYLDNLLFTSTGRQGELALSSRPIQVGNAQVSYVSSADDKVLVVANMGNKWGLPAADDLTKLGMNDALRSLTLGQVLDAVTTTPCQQPADATQLTGYTQFAMSSQRETAVSYEGRQGSKSDPYLAVADVERLCARVDLDLSNAAAATDATAEQDKATTAAGRSFLYPYTYNVQSRLNPTQRVGQVVVEQAAVVNNLQPDCQSYVVRRTATALQNPTPGAALVPEALTYLGQQTHDAQGAATNMLLDPYSLQKNQSGSQSPTLLTTLYGISLAQNALHHTAVFVQSVGHAVSRQPETAPDDAVPFAVLAYPKENIQAPAYELDAFCTALVLRCQYRPEAQHVLHRTMLDEQGNISQTPRYVADPNYQTGQNLFVLRPKARDQHGAEDLYFFTTEADRASFQTDRQALLGDPTAADYAWETADYPTGHCYYLIPLRHAAAGMMQRAIVRNNIYRVHIERILGPGSPGNLDPSPSDVISRIEVVDWNRRTHPEIVM